MHCSSLVLSLINIYFDETVELNLYRLVQESLTNVVKHAQAKEAVVTGQSSQRIGFYTIRIKDDGIGFNPESEQLGVGIPSMNDRVKMLGGTFHLYSCLLYTSRCV